MMIRIISIFILLASIAGCFLFPNQQKLNEIEVRTKIAELQIAIENVRIVPAHPVESDANDTDSLETSSDAMEALDPNHSVDAVNHTDHTGEMEDEGQTEPQVTVSVAVLAVVDSSDLQITTEEDTEGNTDVLNKANRRERLVRNALNNIFVENTLIKVIHPDEQNILKATDEIITNNATSLSTETVKMIGDETLAEVVITAVIDQDGKEVNIAAQHVGDGTIIYQDTIMDWEILVETQEAQPAE